MVIDYSPEKFAPPEKRLEIHPPVTVMVPKHGEEQVPFTGVEETILGPQGSQDAYGQLRLSDGSHVTVSCDGLTQGSSYEQGQKAARETANFVIWEVNQLANRAIPVDEIPSKPQKTIRDNLPSSLNNAGCTEGATTAVVTIVTTKGKIYTLSAGDSSARIFNTITGELQYLAYHDSWIADLVSRNVITPQFAHTIEQEIRTQGQLTNATIALCKQNFQLMEEFRKYPDTAGGLGRFFRDNLNRVTCYINSHQADVSLSVYDVREGDVGLLQYTDGLSDPLFGSLERRFKQLLADYRAYTPAMQALVQEARQIALQRGIVDDITTTWLPFKLQFFDMPQAVPVEPIPSVGPGVVSQEQRAGIYQAGAAGPPRREEPDLPRPPVIPWEVTGNKPLFYRITTDIGATSGLGMLNIDVEHVDAAVEGFYRSGDAAVIDRLGRAIVAELLKKEQFAELYRWAKAHPPQGRS